VHEKGRYNLPMIDGYDIEVRLLAVTGLVRPEELGAASTPDSEKLIEYAGRLCWDTTDKLGTNPRRIQDWIKVDHESVIEHASASFYIRASRTLTHELVRHRLASYSQRSQRFVKEVEPKYIIHNYYTFTSALYLANNLVGIDYQTSIDR